MCDQNESVLEYHHWRTALSIFHESGVFEHLDADVLSAIEWQTKSLILATDITRQQEFLTKFRVRRTCRHLLSAPPVNLSYYMYM